MIVENTYCIVFNIDVKVFRTAYGIGANDRLIDREERIQNSN